MDRNSNKGYANNNNLSEAIKASLRPPRGYCSPIVVGQERNRFSHLLLEYGERQLDDWAVIASSSLVGEYSNSNNNNKASPGRGHHHTQHQINSNEHHHHQQQQQQHQLNDHATSSTNANTQQTYSSCTMRKMDGRLRLCSISLVFEPNDWSRGIIRCPFKYMDAPPSLCSLESTSQTTAVAIKCSRHFIMKTGNVIAPFDTIEKITVFRFTFIHSEPHHFLQLATLLFNNNDPSSPMDHIVPFDASNFIDVREKALTTNLRCSIITPLLSTPGCLIVTHSHIYFQPTATTTAIASKATPWPLASITGYARRYNALKDSALEIFLKDHNSYASNNASVLLAFTTPQDRERVVRFLPLNVPCHTDRDFVVAICNQWTNNNNNNTYTTSTTNQSLLSNYDYLLALNSAAGRTFHDLSRYPVFPWVIQDYKSCKLDLSNPTAFRDLSKPVGALDDKRLEYFQTRFESMQQDMTHPFLYGTHYSAPGYVLYYLVRSMPEHMLCLQNGKFDSPDRMFNSLEQSYASVLTNHADVKELIPEFFDTNSNAGFDFLINARNLNLGITQTGERLHDVQLPPWARSARDFVRKNRKALECDYVTQHLPKWIDLIFGAKSRGEKAQKANNLFHQMAYLGPSDLNRMAGAVERAQAELQATEFGIVPDQLFTSEHPMKQHFYNSNNSSTIISADAIVNMNLNRRDDFLDLSYDYVTNSTNGDTPPPANSKAADQPWELLESPSKSMRSFDEEDDTNNIRDRGWSVDSFGQSSKSHVAAQQQTSSVVAAATAEKKGPVVIEGYAKSDNNHHTLSAGKASTAPTVKTSWLLRNLARRKSSGDDEVLIGEDSAAQEDPQSPKHYLQQRIGNSNISSRNSDRISFVSGEEDQATVTSNIDGCALKRLTSKDVHGDTVSSCALVLQQNGESYLITSSLDGNLIIHTIESGDLKSSTSSSASLLKNPASSTSTMRILSRGLSRTSNRALNAASTPLQQDTAKLVAFRSHSDRDPIACMGLASDDSHSEPLIFTGGHDDSIVVYGMKSSYPLASIHSHSDAVTGLFIMPIKRWRSSSSFPIPESATYFMVSGSWDATVKVWSVSVDRDDDEAVSITRDPLVEFFDADSSVVCVSAIETESGIVIGAGCSDGSFIIWLCGDSGVKELLHKERTKRGSGPCSSITWSESNNDAVSSLVVGGHVLIAGFAAGKISSFILHEHKVSPISEVSVGSPVRCLAVDDDCVVVGCADGGLRVIAVERRAFFDSKPKLWKSVNGKSSPAISCLSICSSGSSGVKKRYLATGADDGNVTLHEMNF